MGIFSWADYFVFIVSLSVSVLIAAYYYKKTTPSIYNYLFGGRKWKSFPIAMSLVAYHIASFNLLVLPVDVYFYGASFIWTSVAIILLVLTKIYIYMPVFYNLQLTSIYEYLEKRFDKKTRLLGSLFWILNLLLFLPLLIYVPCLALSTVSGIHVYIIIVCVCSICVLYTTIGGLKSVIWIDMFQITIVIVTVIVVLIMGVHSSQGIEFVYQKSRNSGRLDIFNFDPDPTLRDSFWIIVFETGALWMSEVCVSQSTVLKLSSVPTFKDCKLATLYFGIGFIMVKVASVLLGLVMYAKYSDCDPFSSGKVQKQDELFPYFVTDVTKNLTCLSGLYIAAIFSAGLSTVSTDLNAAAGVIYTDFLSRFLKTDVSEKKACAILKLIVVVLGTICTFLALVVDQMGEIFQWGLSISGLTIGPQFGMFSLGLLVPRANSKAAFYGGICGIISTASIIFPAKYYQKQGLIVYPEKPLSIDGCDFLNDTTKYYFDRNNLTLANLTNDLEPHFIFRISFYYYTLIGAALTMVFGIIISYLTHQDDRPLDKKLISPLCRLLVKKESIDEATDSLMVPIK